MVPATKPVSKLVYEPIPEALIVLLLNIVGLAIVLQQIPLEVTVAPPSFVMFPPLEAVVWVIEFADVVAEIIGSTAAFVLKVITGP